MDEERGSVFAVENRVAAVRIAVRSGIQRCLVMFGGVVRGGLLSMFE